MSVSAEVFSKQVAWLKQNGFRNMRMTELESSAQNSKRKNPSVIFTFDDGYEDNYLEAYPILKKFGYTAIFYIPYNTIGREVLFSRDIRESNCPAHNRFMNWKQIRSMYRAGMEIGSHTLSHDNLVRMSDNRAKQEIVESKKKIEDKIGDKITSFCYPGGFFSEKHAAWAADAGYCSACTTVHGYFRGDNLFKLPRIAVLASDTFFIFRQKIFGDSRLFNLIH
jgi:peptidoglycan/xylan/chitin deacetylase (PgdA/CDA1 family)